MSQDPNNPNSPGEPFVSQHVTPNSAVARVPEKIGRGVFATGFLIYTGPQEFVIDFIQAVAKPAQLVARVVMAPVVMEQFIAALRDNVGKYVTSFGPPPVMPRNPNEKPLPPDEIYSQLKIPEDLQSGAYANSVGIRHTPAEFYFDFVTNFYPHGAVSARVYMAVPRVPGLVETLTNSFASYQRARGITPTMPGTYSQLPGFLTNQPMPPMPPSPPAPPSPPNFGNNPDNGPKDEPPPPSPRAYPN